MSILKFSEAYLSDLHVNDLIDLMAKSVDELLEMSNFSHNRYALEVKQKEVEVIQRILIAKRSEFPPL